MEYLTDEKNQVFEVQTLTRRFVGVEETEEMKGEPDVAARGTLRKGFVDRKLLERFASCEEAMDNSWGSNVSGKESNLQRFCRTFLTDAQRADANFSEFCGKQESE
jgi:hypothetical protein